MQKQTHALIRAATHAHVYTRTVLHVFELIYLVLAQSPGGSTYRYPQLCVYIEAGVKGDTILNCFYFMNNSIKLKIIYNRRKLLVKKVTDIYSCFILIGFTDAIDYDG